MVNNIPVNGWPQLKDLEAVQPTLDRLDKIEAWKRTVKEETFTGDDITIDNALALPARSLKTVINAIQDLHGYDKPWAGGAGKNKVNLVLSEIISWNDRGTWNGNVYTYNGCTFTVDADAGTITKRGTATEQTQFFTNALSLPAESYKLSGCPSGGSYSTYDLRYTNDYIDLGNGASFVLASASSDVRLAMTIRSGNSDTVVYKPMITLASVPDSDYAHFAPYSNICPISGRDDVVLTRSDGDEISEDFTIQLGQTVYGADINWDTGVMTVTHKRIAPSAVLSGFMGRSNYIGVVATDAIPCTSAQLSNAISDRFVAITGDAQYTQNLSGIAQSLANPTDTSSRVLITVSGITSVADLNTWLAENTPQICYELATPQTIQLTPEQLEMLKGYNRITLSDGYGTIELKALTGANWS